MPAGYAYNSKLNGKTYKQVSAPQNTPTLFESTLGYPHASGPFESFPTFHNGTGMVAFADGHGKALITAPPTGAGSAAPAKPR